MIFYKSMNKKFLKLSIAVLFSVILLSGCQLFNKQADEISTNSTKEEQKTIKATGIIAPKQLSLFDEGTHVLLDEEGDVQYVLMSKIENLNAYEEQEVNIEGVLTNPDSSATPIVDVLKIEAVEQQNEEPQTIMIDDLAISLVLPSNWHSKKIDDVWEFYHDQTTDKSPFTIEKFTLESTDGKQALAEAKNATEITVGEKKAFRMVSGDKITIYVPLETEIYVFKLNPQDDDVAEKLAFLDALTYLKWENQEETTNTEDSDKEKCGGEDNKLCPSGYFCVLTSEKENAEGTCEAVDTIPEKTETTTEKTECAVKTKICPDGTTLTVNPNTCQFASCPAVKTEEPASTPVTKEEITVTEPVVVTTNTSSDPIDIADTTTESTEDREIKAPKSSYDTIENTYLKFTVKYPTNYYWQNFGAINGTSITLGYADQEMNSVSDALIQVVIKSGSVASRSETQQGDDLIILIPRDDNSHFRVIGSKEYKSILWDIAQSIETIE